MAKQEKCQSNPASTGSLGGIFETRVQAAFAVYMLTGGIAPCLPHWPIQKIKLQGRYAGFNIDDFIVFVKDDLSGDEAKLLAQIKRSIKISKGDNEFREVIQAAWNDFNDTDIFKHGIDAFALITTTANTDIRTILDWARTSENEDEFLFKVYKEKFSSKTKINYLEAFRSQLYIANSEVELSDKELWDFLKHFHMLGYDLDSQSSSSLPLLLSLIARYSNDNPSGIWDQLVREVQFFNPEAGTLSLKTISSELPDSFDTKKNINFIRDLKKLKDHGKYIIQDIKSEIGGFHIKRPEYLAQLIDKSEGNNFIILLGERGCGKSSVVREFATNLDEKKLIFCLRTEDLNKSHLDHVFSSIGLVSSLGELEEGLALVQKKYLIIESLEKLLELQNKTAFRNLIHFIEQYPGWTIIATCREYAFQQISFTYFQPANINFTTLLINEFSDDEIQKLCTKFDGLKSFADNPSLKSLLKNPFYADLAYRVTKNGKIFLSSDSEREFRIAVWNDVISNSSERSEGMPLRRRKTFISIAVIRAKQMIYEITASEFDSEALLKLESDSLIHFNSTHSLVRPDHDVLEDWALVEFINEKYHSSSADIKSFLTAIGHEPSMTRAFRLWLNQELKDGKKLKPLILSILYSKEIEKVWQDETITSILLGENPLGFIYELKDQLFEEEANLLKRFCFILRIACKVPDQEIARQFATAERNESLANTVFLKPYGSGWEDVIHFLYEERTQIPKNLLPHISSVLADWAIQIRLDNDLPPIAREAGLLSLYLLNDIKDSYLDRDDEERKKLLNIIIRVVPAIQEEFNKMLDTDLFGDTDSKSRLRYVDDLVETALIKPEKSFLCKKAPETIIKIAFNEWLLKKSKEDQDLDESLRVDVDDYFGLNKYGINMEFVPPSGMKGPFFDLLYYHPIKGLDFIIELLNFTAEKYAHSDLDSPERNSSLPGSMLPKGVQEIEICMNDGTKRKQYCSERLWFGYRGHSVVPYTLQSSLLALENWLIRLINSATDDESLKWTQFFYNYILKNSNSVMPTAILASLATGFPDKLGNVALPVLRIPEFYDLDLKRKVHEHGENGYPWRNKDLELLVVSLQFTELKDEIFKILDELRSKIKHDENWKFRSHRIDIRQWEPEFDKENGSITFTSKNLEPELLEIQNETEANNILINRFVNLFFWSDKLYKNQPLEKGYFAKWQDAYEEIKDLSKIIDDISLSDHSDPILSSIMQYSGGLVKGAAVLLRDHYNEIKSMDFSLGFELITESVRVYADSYDPIVIYDKTDTLGVAAAASVLPICMDFISNTEEKLNVKYLIAIALTHENESVRIESAEGIKNYLWMRDPEFAKECVQGIIEYARFEANERKSFKTINEHKVWITDFRDKLARGKIKAEINNITFETHYPEHLMTSCFMIPNGSINPDHNSLLLRIFTLFNEKELEKYSIRQKRRRNLTSIDHTLFNKFEQLIASHLFNLTDINLKNQFVKQLQLNCSKSPNLLRGIMIYTYVLADKMNKQNLYWDLWEQLSPFVQEIAINYAKNKVQTNKYGTDLEKEQRRLIDEMLFSCMRPQYVDNERESFIYGKDLIIDFVTNAGMNPDVFKGMSMFIYYYPDLFFESGLQILSKNQKLVGGTKLLSESTVFYLERSLNRFLYGNDMSIPKEQYDSCMVLLDALVDTGSSEAYYLREFLIRSKKINN